MKTLIKKSVLASLAMSSFAFAQEPVKEEPLSFEDWKLTFSSAQPTGERGNLSSQATIEVQEGQFFINGTDTSKLMQIFGNPPGAYAGGIQDLNDGYTIIFDFESSGYVKDDDKEDLDADDLLKAFQDSEEETNKQRQAQGYGILKTVGWAFEPKYNEETNNLEWAVIFEDGNGQQTVNHKIKLLGRYGVMNATLLCEPDQLEALRPMLDKTLAGFEYSDGNKYAQFEEGDRIAEFGLTGLVLGGGIFAAAKLGFLAKFWKFIVAGVVGFFALIGKIFKRSS